MNYYLNGVEEQYRNDVILAFETIIEQVANTLDLSLVKQIYVPDNFETAISEFLSQHKLYDIGLSSDETAVVRGKTILYLNQNNPEIAVFLHRELINTLFYEEYKQWFVNCLHHELCHAHDDLKKIGIFGIDFVLSISCKDLKMLLKKHSEVIWSEYFAIRTSMVSAPNELIQGHIRAMFAIIEKAKLKIEKVIFNYKKKYNGDDYIDIVFDEIQYNSSQTLKAFAYILGYCHGFNIGFEKFRVKFQNSEYRCFEKILDILEVLFIEMFKTYPNWDKDAFEKLSNIILDVWSIFGVYPEQTNRGIFLHVP